MSTSDSTAMPRLVCRSDAPYSNGLRCGGGGCPALYRTPAGSFLIVGRRLDSDEKAMLPMDAIEDALEIPAELLTEMVEKLAR